LQVSNPPKMVTPIEADLRLSVQSPVQKTAAIEAQSKPATAEHIDASLNRINKQLEELQDTKVQMEYDKDIDRVIVRYSSRTTGEVVNQIPSEKFVQFEKEFVKAIGLLFDKKV
jgi:uncharacterized FlaG/YvyC family protein